MIETRRFDIAALNGVALGNLGLEVLAVELQPRSMPMRTSRSQAYPGAVTVAWPVGNVTVIIRCQPARRALLFWVPRGAAPEWRRGEGEAAHENVHSLR